jgi:5'-phosphate synthase pdxT subunit
MKIGVLALQGAVIEHIRLLRKLGAEAAEIYLPEDLRHVQGLIIPGGESTAIRKLAHQSDLLQPLKDFARTGAVWGTCAGMILLAREVEGDRPYLGVMDIAVQRNAFGRQVDSFVTDLYVSDFDNGRGHPFPGVFIRAPKLVRAWGQARIIAELPDRTAAAAVQGKLLATAFHPELTDDPRFHRFFLQLVAS